MSAAESPVRLPARDPMGHKGTFGTVVVVGGCAHAAADGVSSEADGVRMVGGPALCALGALRAGAGLARLLMPEPVLNAGLVIAPSATGVALAVEAGGRVISHRAARALDDALTGAHAVAIGPGLGVGDAEGALSLRAVSQEEVPVVVDADALNNLARVPELWRDFRAQAVLTPHPGEFARLASSLGIGVDGKADPDVAAAALAQRLGCVVVLKGARTAVSDGQRVWAHNAANPALATGGSGDVLAGVIAGLLAQHYKRPIVAGERSVTSERMGGLGLFDAACAGVAAHAEAARVWAERHRTTGGMLATDLLEELPEVIERMRQRGDS